MNGSNPLQITDPNAVSDNPLTQGTPSLGEAAYTTVVSPLQKWLSEQRAKSSQMGLWNDQTGLPTAAGLVSAAGQYGNALMMGTTAPGITAYHGSPYDFERFDTSKIGTGEGAQTYGHGLYFAGNENVAAGYRDRLAPATYQTATGAEPAGNVWSALYHSQVGVHPNIAGPVATNVRDMIDESGTIDEALKNFDVPNDPKYGPAYQQAIDAARRMGLATNPGKMYEVNIGADPDSFLHYDKPLYQQSDAVKQSGILPTQPENMLQTGGEFLDRLSRRLGGPDKVAAALQEAGIPGIKYLDQGSRGKGEGTHNYVVFDANTIDILRKYGIAGLMAGAGAAAATGTQQQTQ
jgi:hypothetical protein